MGNVSDEDGNPLEYVMVEVYQKDTTRQEWYPVTWSETDGNGNYDATDLISGTYRIGFYGWGNTDPYSIPVFYVPEYYDDVTTLEDATDITLAVDQTVNGIDAVLTAEEYDDNGNVPPVITDTMLAIFALSFDQPLTSSAALAPLFPETFESIVSATMDKANKTAIILVDLEGGSDTSIWVINDGTAVLMNGLPDEKGYLTTAIDEYDMSDGSMLGGFLTWAISNYSLSNTQVTFSYIGHSSAVVPDVEHLAGLQFRSDESSGLFPLPSGINAHDRYTDSHPRLSILSVQDLAHALDVATNGGENPIAHLDLTKCFAATIEEFYALYPYSEAMSGSPNYTYFDPIISGAVLQALQPNMSPQQIANITIAIQDDLLPDTGHPRLLVAVDSEQVNAVKTAWEATSLELLNLFETDYDGTKEKMLNAYHNSGKYDTTFCEPQDWELEAADALSDMGNFAEQLGIEFGETSAIGIAANETNTLLENAIFARYFVNGQPWFAATEPQPTWTFDEYMGIGLYTDFQGTTVAGTSKTYLSWQAHWYTDKVTSDNPNPYSFVTDTSWDDVFQQFWQGESIGTTVCLQVLRSSQRAYNSINQFTVYLPIIMQ